MNDLKVFMRKQLFIVALLLLVLAFFVPTGCMDKRPAPVDSLKNDSSIADTSSMDSTENVIAQTPMPKAADELFDDFIFNFAANKKLQLKRTIFPLPVYRNGKLEKKIPMEKWRMEHFFMHQDYYTLILDNEKQKQLVKDTTIDHVVVEKIFFKLSLVQQYAFNRIDGQWKMTSIGYKPLYQNMNASFLKFYKHFAVDSAFQVRSMAPEVEFTAPDPEDEFSSISGVIVPQQWPDFKPGLIPSGTIYNIIYGQKYTESNKKIFLIRGIANGMEIELVFKKQHGQWKLIKFNS
jgi:hypothetical protein